MVVTHGARCWNVGGWRTNKGSPTGASFYKTTSVKGVVGEPNAW